MRALPPIALVLLTFAAPARAADPPVRFDRVAIDENFPEAYQVEVADVDGDGKPDLVVLGGPTIAWYQNPTWTKRVIATGGSPLKADIISSATRDLDGDGRAEVAIACDFAMNTPTRGQLFLASQGPTLDAPWTFRKIQDVPSIHRVRWADIQGDGKPELIVAPIFGPTAKAPAYDQDPAHLAAFFTGMAAKTDHWVEVELARRAILHAIEVQQGEPDGRASVWTADKRGIVEVRWNPTTRQPAVQPIVPDRLESVANSSSLGRAGRAGAAPGVSEIHRGRGHILATIEPWHGSRVVVREHTTSDIHSGYDRDGRVIDDTLDDGHALWLADVDSDGTDEVFAGHRGKGHRVAMYRLAGEKWERTILDTTVAAQDLRGGDLDGDGVPDVVAVGGKTHNVVWYRPVRSQPAAK